MKSKIFNRALFYKEIKYGKWFIFLISIQLAVSFLGIFPKSIELYKQMEKGTNGITTAPLYISSTFLIADAFLIITIIIIASCIVGIDRHGRRYETLLSMCFTRSEIIGTKCITTLFAVGVPAFVSQVLMFIIYINNEQVFTFLPKFTEYFIEWLVLNFFVYSFATLFIILIQCLGGNASVSGVIGAILLIFPKGFMLLVSEFISFYYTNIGLSSRVYTFMYMIWDKFSLVTYNINFQGKFEERLIVLIISIIVLIFLINFSFKRNRFEKRGYICMFHPLETILKFGITISTALLSSVIAVYTMTSSSQGHEGQGVKASLIFIISAVIVYFVTNKILELNKN